MGISNTPTAGTDVGKPIRRNLADQILTAGLEVFHSRGYHGSSVQDITTAAGAPKGSFYNHFSSKEVLALAAIDAYSAENPVQVLADRSIPSVERVRAHFDIHHARFVESGYTRGCLVGNFAAEVADHCEPIREKLACALGAWASAIESVIVEAQQVGDIPKTDDPPTLASFIIHSWEGALIHAKTTKTEEQLRMFVESVFGAVLASHRKGRAHVR